MAYDNKKEFASGLYINSTPLTSNIVTSKENFVFFRIGINKRELMDYLESKDANTHKSIITSQDKHLKINQ